jgi:CII-binding regulator of phage lambda lysogenization HflD
MSKQAIDELKERLNNIDIRLARGDEKFNFQSKMLWTILGAILVNFITVIGVAFTIVAGVL